MAKDGKPVVRRLGHTEERRELVLPLNRHNIEVLEDKAHEALEDQHAVESGRIAPAGQRTWRKSLENVALQLALADLGVHHAADQLVDRRVKNGLHAERLLQVVIPEG